jgi:hypothetical protein
MSNRTDIRTLSKEQLITQLEQLGEKPFRAKQIYEWLWQKSAVDFDDMTNLSKELREKLKAHFVIQSISAYKVQKSNDGTIKSAFQLHDKHLIEGVLALRAWFLSGETSQKVDKKEGDRWRIYKLNEIDKINILETKIFFYRPLYNKWDKNFKRIELFFDQPD